MYLCEYTFYPKYHSPEPRYNFGDAVYGYLMYLEMNQQAMEDSLAGWVEDKLVVMCSVPYADALETQHLMGWGQAAYAKVMTLSLQAPTFRIMGKVAQSQEPVHWRNVPAIILSGGFRPIRAANTFKIILAYHLPLSDIQKQDIRNWSNGYGNLERLWFASGVLEIPAYHQLSDPKSELSQAGRKWCRVIEDATHKPTYYNLMRYYGRTLEEEENRPCPSCGKDWKLPEDHQFNKYLVHFCCHDCRLVSPMAVHFDEDDYAEVYGE